jgi:prolyl oligopeptidase
MTEESIFLNDLVYPGANRSDTVDNLHGTEVADPYRWLEDPESADTTSWITAQNKLTDSVLEACPGREDLKKRLTEMYNYPKSSSPFRKNDTLFYFHNDGLQNQHVLYMHSVHDSDSSGAVVLLDPNLIEADGTAALNTYAISEDGTKLAYAISRSGSDWVTIYVRDVATMKDHEAEVLQWAKFTGMYKSCICLWLMPAL